MRPSIKELGFGWEVCNGLLKNHIYPSLSRAMEAARESGSYKGEPTIRWAHH